MSGTVVVDTRQVAENAKVLRQEEQEMEREFAREEARREQAIHEAQKMGGWTSVRDAAMIMGSHFVGLMKIIDRFRLALSPSEVNGLEMVPYPEDTLWKLRDSHLLIAGAPVSFLDIRKASCRSQKDQRLGDFSYDTQPFANRKMAARWYLVSKEIARNSLFRTKLDQDIRIFGDPAHERLGAPELAYVVSVCRLIVKEPMLQNVAALTSDTIVVNDEGVQKEWAVFVGFNGEFGVGVGTCPADRPMANIGAIVSVRPCVR